MELFGDGIAWLLDPANWTDPRNGILLRLWEHISLSAASLLVAGLIALPLGLWIGHTGRGAVAVIAIANIGRAVPSVGWLGIVFPITLALFGRNGLGFLPALNETQREVLLTSLEPLEDALTKMRTKLSR